VGHIPEKLRLHLYIQPLIAAVLCFSHARAATVTEVAFLIKEGKLEEARFHTAQWGEMATLSDAQLFIRAIVTPKARQAAVVYETLIERFPESGYADDALFRLAQLRYAEGLYHASRMFLRRLIREYPDSPLLQRSLYWTGLSYQASGNPDSARFFLAGTLPEESRIELTDPPQDRSEHVPQPEMRRSAAPPSTPVPKTTYATQVGAFTQQNGALMRRAFFEREGYEVRLRTKERDGTLFYLVWVGSFDTADEARAFGAGLTRKYGISYTLVSE